MPKCIIGPNGVAHGPMCKDGRLCGRRGNQLESDRKPHGATSSDEREAIMRAMRQASAADSAVLWGLLERTK
jgi:hypothetical protein